jgi:hypothetical protein
MKLCLLCLHAWQKFRHVDSRHETAVLTLVLSYYGCGAGIPQSIAEKRLFLAFSTFVAIGLLPLGHFPSEPVLFRALDEDCPLTQHLQQKFFSACRCPNFECNYVARSYGQWQRGMRSQSCYRGPGTYSWGLRSFLQTMNSIVGTSLHAPHI